MLTPGQVVVVTGPNGPDHMSWDWANKYVGRRGAVVEPGPFGLMVWMLFPPDRHNTLIWVRHLAIPLPKDHL